MKKRWALRWVLICAVAPWNYAAAYDDPDATRHQTAPAVLADLFLLRPTGLLMTLAGTGIFFATTPFMAIASIAPPHDAVERTAAALVVAPAAFTFMRPLGEFTYRGNGVYDSR